MSITVLNYMDHALVSRINEQATKRAEAAKQNTADDFAATLADSTKALENSQNNIGTAATDFGTSDISTAQSSSNSYSSDELDSIFEEAANTYGVSPFILKSIAKAESGFNASAVSSAGAVGIMQLMPSTAAALGVSNSYDAKENIMGGAKYISQLLSNYQGNISLALAAYNAGSANVDKYGGIPPFTETQNYVKKVLSYMEEFGSAVSNTVSSLSDTVSTVSSQLSSIFNLTGTARDEANQMLADFFSSKNISKDALDILTAILKLKNMASYSAQASTVQTTTDTTGTTTSYNGEKVPVVVSVVSHPDMKDISDDLSMRKIPSVETDSDDLSTNEIPSTETADDLSTGEISSTETDSDAE